MFPGVTLKAMEFYPRTVTREGGMVPSYTHCEGNGRLKLVGTAFDCIMEQPAGRFLVRTVETGEFSILGIEDFKKVKLTEQIKHLSNG